MSETHEIGRYSSGAELAASNMAYKTFSDVCNDLPRKLAP